MPGRQGRNNRIARWYRVGGVRRGDAVQTAVHKEAIVAEVARLLKPGGRYGIHELCLVPDDLEEGRKLEISQALSKSIHLGARPLTPGE
jgi:hypothetical protein